MREFFEKLGLEYRDDDKYIFDTLQLKEAELLDRLDVVEEEERRKELESQLEKVESYISELLPKQHKVSTGIYREVDNYEDLRNGKSRIESDKTDKEIFDELDSLLETADYLTAIEKLETIGELGNKYAQIKLGYMYRYGKRVDKDLQKSIYWYEKAGLNGDGDAYNYIGVIYALDYKNPQKAFEYYKKAAEAESGWGHFNYANIYANGNGIVPINKAVAFEHYKKAADLGVGKGALYTGAYYAKGIGVLQDDTEALKYFNIAAEQGIAGAMDWLGSFYFGGRGVIPDMQMAADWYAKAADAGMDSSNYYASLYYFTLKDYQKALNYAIRARDKKIKGADELIAKIDATGYVLPIFVSMAEKGYVEQQIKLAKAYESGDKGVEIDEKKASEWYEKAALAGNAEAQYKIAQRYEKGIGVAVDSVKSKKYYELSGKAGFVPPEIAERRQKSKNRREKIASLIPQIIQMLLPLVLLVLVKRFNISVTFLGMIAVMLISGAIVTKVGLGLEVLIVLTTIISIGIYMSSKSIPVEVSGAPIYILTLVIFTDVIQRFLLKDKDEGIINRVVPLLLGAIITVPILPYNKVEDPLSCFVIFVVCPLIPSLICLIYWGIMENVDGVNLSAEEKKFMQRKGAIWVVCLLIISVVAFLYYREMLSMLG